MGIVKAHRYEVFTHWLGGRKLALESAGKPALRVATPPDFKGGVEGVWSPEELLVGSVATCYELTLIAIAEHRRVPLRAVVVDATGHIELKDGRYRFVAIELDAQIEAGADYVDDVREIAALAEERCIVGVALETPLHVAVTVRVPDAETTQVA